MIRIKVRYHLAVKLISFLFVILFVYAATSKLLDYKTFTLQLAQSPLLSAYAGIITWSVPGLEILIAIFLILPRYRKIGLYASFFLMVLFTTYIYIILNYADFVPCSCGGVLENLNWTQHFTLNIIFICLAIAAILMGVKTRCIKKIILIGVFAITGVGAVVLLFNLSEEKMQRNNAFLRRYIPHYIEKIHSWDLKFNSYYLAGLENGQIYLGNSTAPLKIVTLDTSLSKAENRRITLDNMELPYRAVRFKVFGTNIWVYDGTVPIILKGNTSNLNAKTIFRDPYYISELIPIDSSKTIIRVLVDKNIIGVFSENTPRIKFNSSILNDQGNGVFDTDGQLIYNRLLKKLIFTYYYRNEFIVFDPDLDIDYRGKTIDTVSRAVLNIVNLNSSNKTKLGAQSLLINAKTATDSHFLYIASPRLGKSEPEELLDVATVIDVYDLIDKSYQFSFYLYHQEGKKMSEFMIRDYKLYALMGDEIIIFKMKEN
ncbi:MauE/DoxX family redox-associated membrane protein [Marixanthomonas ophiurae]|nr:MauE/DoxX family redox-associated membrane protein [Marixanthomonas ophiurae]